MPEIRQQITQPAASGDSREPFGANDTEASTDSLSPAAARRFERFTRLVDKFERAASSGALTPPLNLTGEQA